jgi:hypothetical protein
MQRQLCGQVPIVLQEVSHRLQCDVLHGRHARGLGFCGFNHELGGWEEEEQGSRIGFLVRGVVE